MTPPDPERTSGTEAHFSLGGMGVTVRSDKSISPEVFSPVIREFAVPGMDTPDVVFQHHFGLPDVDLRDLGEKVYARKPWVVFRSESGWTYLSVSPPLDHPTVHGVLTFDAEQERADIYHKDETPFLRGEVHSLTALPSDQPFLAPALAHRDAFYLHASSVLVDGACLLFPGTSGAGKTTAAGLLKEGHILCEDRSILRRQATGFRVYGSWSNAWLPRVSARSGPLAAILFPVKSERNELTRLAGARDIVTRPWPRVVRPLVTPAWWHKMFDLLEEVARNVPCYEMSFDRSGGITPALLELVRSGG